VPYYYHTIDQKDIYGLGSNVIKNDSWVAHEVKPEDTLDSLALHYYNNPTYWWVIAYFNNIQDAFIKLDKRYDILKIPQITSLEFGDQR
jgi:nucleoid-associated protein YgaU